MATEKSKTPEDEDVVELFFKELSKSDNYEATIQIARKITSLKARERAFLKMLDWLKHPDPYLRLRIVSLISEFCDERAVEPLIELLCDHEADTMLDTIVDVLANLGDSRAIRPTIEQFPYLEFKTIFGILDYGDDAIIPLVDALDHDHHLTRKKSEWVLASSSVHNWMSKLDAKQKMKLAALCVDFSSHKFAAEVVEELLKDNSSSVRFAAEESLHQLNQN